MFYFKILFNKYAKSKIHQGKFSVTNTETKNQQKSPQNKQKLAGFPFSTFETKKQDSTCFLASRYLLAILLECYLSFT